MVRRTPARRCYASRTAAVARGGTWTRPSRGCAALRGAGWTEPFERSDSLAVAPGRESRFERSPGRPRGRGSLPAGGPPGAVWPPFRPGPSLWLHHRESALSVLVTPRSTVGQRRVTGPGMCATRPGGIPLASSTGESMELMGVREYRPADGTACKIHWKLWACQYSQAAGAGIPAGDTTPGVALHPGYASCRDADLRPRLPVPERVRGHGPDGRPCWPAPSRLQDSDSGHVRGRPKCTSSPWGASSASYRTSWTCWPGASNPAKETPSSQAARPSSPTTWNWSRPWPGRAWRIWTTDRPPCLRSVRPGRAVWLIAVVAGAGHPSHVGAGRLPRADGALYRRPPADVGGKSS